MMWSAACEQSSTLYSRTESGSDLPGWLVRPGVDVGGGLVLDEDGVVAEAARAGGRPALLSDGKLEPPSLHLSFNA